jgi:hypothetical protein
MSGAEKAFESKAFQVITPYILEQYISGLNLLPAFACLCFCVLSNPMKAINSSSETSLLLQTARWHSRS